ncbi:V-type proton ATPase subunit G, partial [Stegodyphus mimosarum]
MMKQDSQSIQQLLVAEKRAEEKVNQARKRKVMRLKQAKEEAQVEMQKFRAEKEQEFKEFEAKFLGTKESNIMKIELDTDKAMKEMEKLVKLNKSAVIDYLLELVFTIECQP